MDRRIALHKVFAIAITAILTAALVLLPSAGLPASAQQESVPGEVQALTPLELQITRFYRAVLDRDPDLGGMGYWFKLLSTGTDPVLIAESFAQSKEFENRFGVPAGSAGDLMFLTQVYRNVLDRGPDAEGRRYWSQLLDAGVPRSHIVLYFSESDEFGQRTGLVPSKLASFEAEVLPISAEELGASWRPGCPVPPRDLRLLKVSFVNFLGEQETGEVVVHADAAQDIVVAFARLYEFRYPIESMRPVDEFGADDNLSMEANNTSAFNCRKAVFSASWSRHAYGRAIDLNPLVNPYVKGAVVLPEVGRPFADRTAHSAAAIREGDAVVEAFDSIGWEWGGRWNSTKDYQHFSISAR